MTTYTVADRNYPTKKSFMEAVKSGRNVQLYGMTPAGSISTTLRNVHDNVGFTFTVSNNSRSWSAECVVRTGKRIRVK